MEIRQVKSWFREKEDCATTEALLTKRWRVYSFPDCFVMPTPAKVWAAAVRTLFFYQLPAPTDGQTSIARPEGEPQIFNGWLARTGERQWNTIGSQLLAQPTVGERMPYIVGELASHSPAGRLELLAPVGAPRRLAVPPIGLHNLFSVSDLLPPTETFCSLIQ